MPSGRPNWKRRLNRIPACRNLSESEPMVTDQREVIYRIIEPTVTDQREVILQNKS